MGAWEMQSQFVLSPLGAGFDCHRTWEALLLGCIPIVKAAKMNDLFEGLPVVAVNHWQEINPTFLENTAQEIVRKTFNLEKLSMRYWQSQIKSLESK